MRSRLIRVVGSRRIPRSPTSVRATKLWHRRALEIRTDGHRSRVLLLYLRNRLVEIARIEVAENQPRRLRVTCDPPDDMTPTPTVMCRTSRSAPRANSTKRGSVPV